MFSGNSGAYLKKTSMVGKKRNPFLCKDRLENRPSGSSFVTSQQAFIVILGALRIYHERDGGIEKTRPKDHRLASSDENR